MENINASGNIENNKFDIEKLALFIQDHPDMAITGSVSFYLQTGLSLGEAIQKANDIDIFYDGNIPREIYSAARAVGNDTKIVTMIESQKKFSFKTTRENYIKKNTEYGILRLIPIDTMVKIDLERASLFIVNKSYVYEPDDFKKLYTKLNRYLPHVEDEDLKSRIRKTISDFSVLIR